jgi:hypothetical protein
MKRIILAAAVLAASVMILCSGCSRSIVEKPLPGDALIVQGGERFSLYRGDIYVRYDMPGYELDVSADSGELWTWSAEMGEEKLREFHESLQIECGDESGIFTVCRPVELESGEKHWGHIEDENVTVRVVIRKDGKPVGYALLAAWGNNGAYFDNKGLIKAVTFTDADGNCISVSEKRVNELIDKAAEELIVNAGLFSPDNGV